MTTGSYLWRPAAVSIAANKPGEGCSQHLKREIKASVELVDLNFIDVHISHPLGGLQSKWKESNILLHKLYEQKRGFSNVCKLAAAAVATCVCSVAICECSFFALSRFDSPHRRSMIHGRRQRNLALLAFEKSRTKKIDLDDCNKSLVSLATRSQFRLLL